MALFDIFADLSGLASEIRAANGLLLRIAEALERVAPPLAADPTASAADAASGAPEGRGGKGEHAFHVAESPEEYRERTESEAAFALSLGVAPWSPAFQVAINEMRNELLSPKVEIDEETGQRIERQYTETEADDIVRQAFRIAQAEAGRRAKAEQFESAGSRAGS